MRLGVFDGRLILSNTYTFPVLSDWRKKEIKLERLTNFSLVKIESLLISINLVVLS